MAKRSLFSILSDQPWWVSLLVAAIVFALAELVFPPLAFFIALPFAGVAAFLAYKQWRRGPPVAAAERLAALRAMSWENFSLIISEAYRRQGYAVEPSDSNAYDFALQKNGRTTLVQCRRWKVNQVGVEPLSKLSKAIVDRDAVNGVCIAAGEFSANAREYASGKPIGLVSGEALVELVGIVDRTTRRWFSH